MEYRMIAVKLTRCESYTLVPNQFVQGKIYHVSDEIGKDLLGKLDEYGINYFEAVELNSSSNAEGEAPEGEAPAESGEGAEGETSADASEDASTGKKKAGPKVTI
jgi:hypothetical protein